MLVTIWHLPMNMVIEQNITLAKQYYQKSCNLGDKESCDIYKEINKQ